MSIPCSHDLRVGGHKVAPSTVVWSSGRLSDQQPARPANVGRVQAEILMESLILAQDERWRRA